MNQLTMLGGRFNETVKPFSEGDIIVHRTWGWLVIKSVDRDPEACEPEILLCVKLTDGSDCITFPREILYRSVG
jgi:hypothetical protein